MNRLLAVFFLLSSPSYSQLGTFARAVATQKAEIVSAPRSAALTTRLLFPAVFTQNGFDTEITISNTSQDTLGSVPLDGTCSLDFYGPGTPPSTTTPTIAAGKQLVFNLSQGAGSMPAVQGFSGYITATCAFPLATGSAKAFAANSVSFIQDAQVITLPRSTSTPQNLLFPFATNQAGFDTGIVIANTSTDPFGTPATAGACTLNFYGANSPAPVNTGTIFSGASYYALLHNIAPNFQGYLIASCNFTGAAGLAFTGDLNLTVIVMTVNPELLVTPRGNTARPLLFSAITNQNGQDSGIAIANTSSDPFGTAPASGSCTLRFYGANPPAPLNTGTIAAGATYVTLTSIVSPNFNGYVTATCTFPHARGWSFTSPLGANAEGDGESAEVVTTPRAAAPAPLLFSGVTNWNYNDTQITIVNTSLDSFGTTPTSGTCTLTYFGEKLGGGTLPAPQTSASIPAGSSLIFTLRQGNAAQGIIPTPDFRGYIFAACTFPLARGVARVTLYPPVLSLTKTHSGNFGPGQQNATYTLTVSNRVGASPTSGTVTVTDTLPPGLSLGSMAGTGWNCAANSCTRADSLAAAASFSPITVTVNVAANPTSPQVNVANVSGGGSNPATASDSTVISLPIIASIVNAASNQAGPLAPGASISIFGSSLAPGNLSCPAGGVAPTVCNGTTVRVNGNAVPLLFVSAAQVNFVVPYGITGPTAIVQVSTPAGASVGSVIAVAPVAPALFSGGLGVFLNSAFQPVSAANPARAGDLVIAYVNGLGTTNPAVADGAAGPSNPLALFIAAVSLTVGGQPATITFAGLATGQIGIGQVNFTVPLGVTGNQPVIITAGGVVSPAATIPLTCGYLLSGNGAFNSSAGGNTVTITSPAACAWTATTATPWIHITPPAGGSGNGQVNYTVDANPTAFPRSGSIGVAAQTFNIVQGPLLPLPAVGLRFVPITPCRIADTRDPNGPYGGPSLAVATPRDFDIQNSGCHIPLGAQAYSLNLTVVPMGPLGFLSVWPAGQPQPVVSTLNSDGRVKANAAIVPAGTNGAITLFGSHATQVIIDINGYFVPALGNLDLAFYPLTPCRIADTRLGSGTFGAPALTGGVVRTFPLRSGPCNIPAAAQAYALNMTVVPGGPLGFLTAWPAGSAQPGSSTLNAPTGAVTANAAIVRAGDNGAIAVIATHTTNLIIDINGYFAPPIPGGMQFYTATPCRVVDTRLTAGPLGAPRLAAAAAREFVVGASTCGIPAAAGAFSLNATVVPPAALGFLSLWGSGSQPTVSTLNAGDGSIVANAALVPASATGSVNAFASHLTHLILDINGYFAQ